MIPHCFLIYLFIYLFLLFNDDFSLLRMLVSFICAYNICVYILLYILDTFELKKHLRTKEDNHCI